LKLEGEAIEDEEEERRQPSQRREAINLPGAKPSSTIPTQKKWDRK